MVAASRGGEGAWQVNKDIAKGGYEIRVIYMYMHNVHTNKFVTHSFFLLCTAKFCYPAYRHIRHIHIYIYHM